MLIWRHTKQVGNISYARSMKPGSCYDANFATDINGSCHNDNLEFCWWRQSWHRDNFYVSVMYVVQTSLKRESDHDANFM